MSYKKHIRSLLIHVGLQWIRSTETNLWRSVDQGAGRTHGARRPGLPSALTPPLLREPDAVSPL
eukprot:9295315-Pyramimonas_sp.AAC.1